jgi:hypothetical protein
LEHQRGCAKSQIDEGVNFKNYMIAQPPRVFRREKPGPITALQSKRTFIKYYNTRLMEQKVCL